MMSSPVRVLHVLPDLGVGGGQSIVERVAQTADPRRITVLVASCGGPWDLQRSFHALGVPVFDLGADTQPGGVATLTRRLVALVTRARVDVIHVHSERERWAAALAGLLTGTPVVTHIHALWFHLELDANAGWKRRLGVQARRWLESRTTAAYVATSSAARARYEGRVDAPITEYVPGVDWSRFESEVVDTARVRTDLGVGSGPLLVCVARLEPGKGHATLIDLVDGLRASHPDVQLVMVGDGSLRSDLERMVQERGLGSVVTFAGARSDVVQILQAADVFVFASESESLGVAVVEAMAAGTPVVAFALEPFATFLRDGVTGRAVTPRDEAALAAATAELLADPPARAALGDAGREQVRRVFDAHRAADALADVYERVSRSRPDATARGQRA